MSASRAAVDDAPIIAAHVHWVQRGLADVPLVLAEGVWFATTAPGQSLRHLSMVEW